MYEVRTKCSETAPVEAKCVCWSPCAVVQQCSKVLRHTWKRSLEVQVFKRIQHHLRCTLDLRCVTTATLQLELEGRSQIWQVAVVASDNGDESSCVIHSLTVCVVMMVHLHLHLVI